MENNLNKYTIQTATLNAIPILSLQFINNYISEFNVDENNAAIKKVLDTIILAQKEIKKNQNQLNAIA